MDLFNRLYNNRCAIADKQYIWNSENEPQQFKNSDLSKFIFNKDNKDILDSSNDSYRKRVAHSLDLPTKQLIYLIKKFRSHFDNDKLWNTANEERSMLTIFYRVSKLAHICEISLEELFIIFDILEKDPAVRKFNNSNVLINFQINQRDCYQIIVEDNVENSMWLIQVVYGLTQWMQKNDFSAHELLKITSGDYVDKINLKKIDDTLPVQKVKTQKEIDDQEKLVLFNSWHQGFKLLHFKESLLKEAGLDSRTSRLVYETLSESKYHLTKKEPRLISFDANVVKKAAIEAVNKIDTITEKDLLGLGIGEKIAAKIYDNLIHKGHLNTQGRLIEDKLQLVDHPLDRLNFSSSEKEELFDLLIGLEHITNDRKIPEDKLDYFLNIDNALAISLEGFEDYNKDVFFLLHAIAKEQSAMVNQVVNLVKTLAEKQETFIYKQFKIYLFAGDRYWIYDGVTYKLEEEKGKELKELSVHFAGITIDAAFVDNNDRNVIIAGGKYYQQAKDSKVWELKERVWGKLHNNFQNLDKIDAAYTDSSGYTYLFSGEEYVRTSSKSKGNTDSKKENYIDEGYPKTIALHWKHEPGNKQLPKPFQESIDAAFVGHDGKTYLFKNDQFVSSEDLTKAQSILTKWGRSQNNLKTTGKVDAAYIDGSQIMIFCGDQIFSFDDCLENDDVMPSEGFPKLIKEHFQDIPAEFHQDIDAAFKINGVADFGYDLYLLAITKLLNDKYLRLFSFYFHTLIQQRQINESQNKTYLFKDKKYITIDSGKKSSSSDDIKGYWGKTSNPLTNGKVDAAFVGLDGKTYLFSGTQYFRYSSDDYSEVDAGYPKSIKPDWGGLEQVNAAFVLDGKTYLFDNSTPKPNYIRCKVCSLDLLKKNFVLHSKMVYSS